MTVVWIVCSVVYLVLLLILCIKVIMDTRSSAKAVAYLLIIFLLPLAGASIYLLFGRNIKRKSLYSKKLGKDKERAAMLQKKIESFENLKTLELDKDYDDFVPTAQMLMSQHKSILTDANEIKIYKNGEDKFPELLDSLLNAKHHIHIEYYIYEDDDIGQELANILIQKAKEGVKVRFIYDDFGSKDIRKKLVKRMREAGVEAFPFYEVIFILLADRLNYRNHRKIVVVDGEIAYVGGINVSNKYVNNGKSDLYWRDTHMRIKGEAVWTLQHIFLCDWNFASDQDLGFEDEFFRKEFELDSKAKTLMQIAASGPDSFVPSILYTYLSAIYAAKEYIYLVTPYFIPGLSFIQGLHAAVLRGVKVKLIVPGISDSMVTNAASFSFYDELMEMGIEVHLYEKGFVHAKTVVIDDAFCMVGTANLDIRSFEFNFEVNAVVYDKKHAMEMRKTFEEDLKDCKELTLEDYKSRPLYTRFFERIVRLVSPLM